MAFDPWGARRETNDWKALDQSAIDSSFSVFNKPITNRGFTGHEMLDDTGIVNMNGRIYDANLARFMQADPYIQSPTTIGSLNRYSYVLNNPLNATDPTGYFFSKMLHVDTGAAVGFRGFKAFHRQHMRLNGIWHTHRILNHVDPNLVPAISAVVGRFGIYGQVISAAINANNTFYLTGSIEDGAKVGVVSYMASQTFQTGSFIGDLVINAIYQGIISELSGGEFRDGARASAISSVVSYAGSKTSALNGSVPERTFKSAIIGGTSSR